MKNTFTKEQMKEAFDSAREFNSLDGVVDIHIVLPMGGDMSDLQPLYNNFEDYYNKIINMKEDKETIKELKNKLLQLKTKKFKKKDYE